MKGRDELRTAITVCLISTISNLIWSHVAIAQYMEATTAPVECLHATTNVATGECFDRKAKEADEILNQVYDKIQKYFGSNDLKDDAAALRTAQKHWIAFRDADCRAAGVVYERGSASAVNVAACMEATTRQRTEELKLEYDWLLDR